MCEGLDFLRTLARAVQEKLHGIAVRMHPDGDRLAVALIPIPVRKQVQHRFRSPPGFVVMKIIFGKPAGIDDAKLRADRRPSVRRGLTAIIEAGPGETSGKPFACGIEFPPLLRELRPVSMV